MAQKIQLADLAKRHPDRYREHNPPELVVCPLCGSGTCTTPEHQAELDAERAAAEAAERTPPPAPSRRRLEREPGEPSPYEADPNRLVAATEDAYDDVYYPGCVTPSQVLRIVAGQSLPWREAVEHNIPWTELPGPPQFEVTFVDGVPVVLDPPLIKIIETPEFVVAPEDREEIDQ